MSGIGWPNQGFQKHNHQDSNIGYELSFWSKIFALLPIGNG